MAKLRFLQGDRMSGVSNEPQRDGLHRTIQDSIGKRLRRRRRRVLMKKTETSIRGAVAQWLEHLLCKQDVEGSSPFGSKTPSWGGGEADVRSIKASRERSEQPPRHTGADVRPEPAKRDAEARGRQQRRAKGNPYSQS